MSPSPVTIMERAYLNELEDSIVNVIRGFQVAGVKKTSMNACHVLVTMMEYAMTSPMTSVAGRVHSS